MAGRVESFNLGMPWEDSHGYSQAFRVGNWIHISGQVPHDEHGAMVGGGDIGIQARAVFDNMDRTLAGIGATKYQVVETELMVVGLEQRTNAVSDAHRAYFGNHRPASTVFGVSALAFPGQLIEVSARVSLDLPQ